MPRNIINLAALQFLLIFLGFIALGIVLKMYGYPDSPDLLVRWNRLAVLLRDHGLWLLLLPAIWSGFAWHWDKTATGPRARVTLVAGLVIACVPMLLFIYAAIFPYTRGLLQFAR